MCKIENKRIVLVDFKLLFQEKWIGNALCSYEYNTEREGFQNLLKIDLNILNPLKNANTPTYKCFESEIYCTENFSQAFELINDYLKKELLGIEINAVKTIFEFNYVSTINNKIRLTLKQPNMFPYEIENRMNGKCLVLSDMNEEESIKYGYENLL